MKDFVFGGLLFIQCTAILVLPGFTQNIFRTIYIQMIIYILCRNILKDLKTCLSKIQSLLADTVRLILNMFNVLHLNIKVLGQRVVMNPS